MRFGNDDSAATPESFATSCGKDFEAEVNADCAVADRKDISALSIIGWNPARNAAASAKSSVGPAPTHIRLTSIRSNNPPRIAVSRFARLHIITNGTASTVAAIRSSPRR